MNMKKLTIPQDIFKRIATEFGTPIHVYDEAGIRATAKELKSAFTWANNYKNYFAVKATPNPNILKVLASEGMGFDCSTGTELVTMQKMGVSGDDIFFTSNNVAMEDFELAIKLGATVNLDDPTQAEVFAGLIKDTGYGRVSCRYTPKTLKGGGNDIIGSPKEAKYGMSLENLTKMYMLFKSLNVTSFGLHAMVVSNELDATNFGDTARLIREAVEYVESKAGIKLDFINLGGGFGVNYSPYQQKLAINEVSQKIKVELGDLAHRLQVVTENGRYVTGPHGYLLTRARYVMQKYKTYVGVDASMHNLMRPAMYGSYHHISVLGGDFNDMSTYDIVGSLCENNDKFAINRKLPHVAQNDLLVIHDTGAHGHAMGFNYNGMLRSAEVLYKTDGTLKLIRRAESLDDYFATVV